VTKAFQFRYQQVAEKKFGMLREPHASTGSAERKILNDIKTPPFVLSTVEGLRQSFSAADQPGGSAA